MPRDRPGVELDALARIHDLPSRHPVQGPPQAVAVTPDGKLSIVAAATRYDNANKKELFGNFLQQC